MRHPNRPQVILHHEHDGELPQRGHIEAFKELPVVTGAVSEKSDGDVVASLLENFSPILGGEGGAGGDRDALTDEGEASDEVVLAREHVHGASLATAASGSLAEELGHYGTGRNALAEGVNMVSVGADDGVTGGEKADEAGGDGFLAIVEVDEAKHLAAVVHLSTHVLESAPQHHVFVQIQRLLAADHRKSGAIQLLLFDVGGGNSADGAGQGDGYGAG